MNLGSLDINKIKIGSTNVNKVYIGDTQVFPLYILDLYPEAVAAWSIYALTDKNLDVVRVRRSSDNKERDFTSNEVINGTLESWVNGELDPLPLDTETAAAAYSLRNLSTSYSGSVVRVRRSSDNAEADFTATEILDGTLTDWVNEDITQYNYSFSH